MYYGCVDLRLNQGSCVIITKPCPTREDADTEYEKSYRAMSRYHQILYWGRNNGILKLPADDLVSIPQGKFGVTIRF